MTLPPPPADADAHRGSPDASPRGVPPAFDAWIRSNPWHPRIAPFFCWIIFMTLGAFLPEPLTPLQPMLYLAQCVATVWLLWVYRRLLPELTLRVHWLAIPTGVLLLVAWVVLGYAMTGELGWRSQQLADGQWRAAVGEYPYALRGELPNRFGPELDAAGQPVDHPIRELIRQSPALGWTWMILRLLGMSLIVPLFEELFIRSAMLRGLQRPGPTLAGLLQFATDLPGLGDRLAQTDAGRRVNAQPPRLTQQLESTAVGRICFFGVAASTLVFMLSHGLRDWPGCIACGLVWCGLIWWTNRPRRGRSLGGGEQETWQTVRIHPNLTPPPLPNDSAHNRGRLGLGPVAWSHGLTNALLWGYTLLGGDWRFL